MNVINPRTAQLTLVALIAISVAACGTPDPPASQPAAPPAAKATPTAGAAAEHPEVGEAATVTEDSLTTAITTHMQAEAARQGGSLTIDDPVRKRPLQLTLTTVHREGTRKLPDGRYFACADFKGADGHTYDLDVFMKQDLNGLTADEVTVHKQDGQPRYRWVQADGAWKRAPVSSR
ncbi:MAG: hypothetical protein EXQ50_05380 [Acidobacteria bacterium]|nr:hypothetical protein [Acidobacteriota bacterium]MSO61513.1 hypothetical protein [Acidobacteriota bacterium]